MLTITALLFALNAAAPASAAFYEHVGRYSPVEATSPAKARFRAVKKDAMPAPTQAPEYHPDLAMMPLMKRAPAGTDTCGFHTDDGSFSPRLLGPDAPPLTGTRHRDHLRRDGDVHKLGRVPRLLSEHAMRYFGVPHHLLRLYRDRVRHKST